MSSTRRHKIPSTTRVCLLQDIFLVRPQLPLWEFQSKILSSWNLTNPKSKRNRAKKELNYPKCLQCPSKSRCTSEARNNQRSTTMRFLSKSSLIYSRRTPNSNLKLGLVWEMSWSISWLKIKLKKIKPKRGEPKERPNSPISIQFWKRTWSLSHGRPRELSNFASQLQKSLTQKLMITSKSLFQTA
jgi:hypothetical protein